MTKKQFVEFLKEIEKIPREKYNAIVHNYNNIFQRFIASFLSTRTKDEITYKVCERLFKIVKTPDDLLKISLEDLERLIYPVGFYKTKARRLKEIAKILVKKFPKTKEEWKKLPGVGEKVASLIINEIAVDTHVHRIVNRIYKPTKNYEETKRILEELPKEWHSKINHILVNFGQKICNVTPKCNICPIKNCPHKAKLETLKGVLKEFTTKILPKKGTYILKMRLDNYFEFRNWKFYPGYYFYVGSAFGKGGVKSRVERHLKKDKKLHWHIDYFLQKAKIVKVYAKYSKEECKIAKKLNILEKFKGFGCSDCKCVSHLFRIPF
jgi:endonuclease-3